MHSQPRPGPPVRMTAPQLPPVPVLTFAAERDGGPPAVLRAGGVGEYALRPAGGPPLRVLRRATDVLRVTSDQRHFAMAGVTARGEVSGCPLTGAEMQSPDGGLLNMNGPELRGYRQRVNALFTRREAERTRPAVAAAAHALATRLRGTTDVLARFAVPLAAVAVSAEMGTRPGDYDEVDRFSRVAFSVVPAADAVPSVAQAWDDLYAFYGARMRQTMPARIAQALDGHTADQVVHVTGTVSNGFGAVLPVLAVSLVETATHRRDFVRACLAGRGSWEELANFLLRNRAMFPVELPRVCLRDTRLSGLLVHAGEQMLPSLIAATHDPDGSPCDIAFGPGPHMCPGAHLTRVWLSAALEAFWTAHPRARLVGGLAWQPGTLSVPRKIVLALA
jgi:cytochrome P450